MTKWHRRRKRSDLARLPAIRPRFLTAHFSVPGLGKHSMNIDLYSSSDVATWRLNAAPPAMQVALIENHERDLIKWGKHFRAAKAADIEGRRIFEDRRTDMRRAAKASKSE